MNSEPYIMFDDIYQDLMYGRLECQHDANINQICRISPFSKTNQWKLSQIASDAQLLVIFCVWERN